MLLLGSSCEKVCCEMSPFDVYCLTQLNTYVVN
jgi:hypothetical protein